MSAKDDNDLHRAGELPSDPWAGATPIGGSHAKGERTAGPSPVWPKLEVPERTLVRRALPADLLPFWVRRWCEATAKRLECDPAHPAAAALAALAASVQRKAWLTKTDGYKTALTLWTAVMSDSGGGKSTITDAACEPISEWQRERAEAMLERIAVESTRRKVKEAEHRRALKTIETKSGDELRSAREDAERIAVELATLKVVVAPQIVCGNPTAARLVQLLAEQDGRIALMAGEVDLSTLLGLGGGKGAAPTDSGILNAFDGVDVTEERMKRENGLGGDRLVAKAHLSMGIASQPSRLAALLKRNPDLLHNGFFARCLYVVPADLSGSETYEPHPMPASAQEAYRAGLRRLLDLPWPAVTEIQSVTLSCEAERLWLDFRRGELKRRMSKSGDMSAGPLRTWAKRAHAHALHLAGVLHIAEHAPDHFRAQVSGETMERVLRAMTEYFLPTAVDVLELLGARPGDRLVDQLLTKQRRWWAEGKKTCTERDLYRAAGINPKDLVEPLSELIDCGALVPPPAPPPGPRGAGRPPAPVYWLNPALGGAA